MGHIGIDVHKRASRNYILAGGGEVVEERICTEPERFAAVLGARPRARKLIEASTDSEWVARCLEALGHEVIDRVQGLPLPGRLLLVVAPLFAYGAVSCHERLSFASLCRVMCAKRVIHCSPSRNRSKFNVPLGLESQGFCVLPKAP